jgi:hypothetical protein
MDADSFSPEANSLGMLACQVYTRVVEKTAKKFRSFAEADLLTSLSGVTIDEAFGTRASAVIDGLPVFTLAGTP